MSEHTPGPWACDMRMAKVYSLPTNLMVASISIPNNATCQDAWPADARLIAAAPELLDALKAINDLLWLRPDIVNKISALMGEAEQATFARASAAIAKAEGRL